MNNCLMSVHPLNVLVSISGLWILSSDQFLCLRSSELFALSVEAVWSDHAFFVACVGGLVAMVTRDLHLVVLNHVLLDDSLTITQS